MDIKVPTRITIKDLDTTVTMFKSLIICVCHLFVEHHSECNKIDLSFVMCKILESVLLILLSVLHSNPPLIFSKIKEYIGSDQHMTTAFGSICL